MKRPLILHPFLFSVYPILFLFAHNIEHFLLNEILVPIALVTGLALLSWLLLGRALKNREKAGLLVSLTLFLFFSYGHFYNSLGGIEPIVMFGRHKILIAAGSVLFVLGAYFSIKATRDLRNLTSFLNIVAASLVAISLVSIGAYVIETRAWEGYGSNREPVLDSARPDDLATLPNIYYIILDGYARDDILLEMYHYDNAEFLDYLTQSGFYIARNSRSNYSQTSLSLASSLNMGYLDELVNRVGEESDNRVPLEQMIKNSQVRDFLE